MVDREARLEGGGRGGQAGERAAGGEGTTKGHGDSSLIPAGSIWGGK